LFLLRIEVRFAQEHTQPLLYHFSVIPQTSAEREPSNQGAVHLFCIRTFGIHCTRQSALHLGSLLKGIMLPSVLLNHCHNGRRLACPLQSEPSTCIHEALAVYVLNLFVYQVLLSLNSVLERDGRTGSLAKFDCSVSFERFANVPFSEGMV